RRRAYPRARQRLLPADAAATRRHHHFSPLRAPGKRPARPHRRHPFRRLTRGRPRTRRAAPVFALADARRGRALHPQARRSRRPTAAGRRTRTAHGARARAAGHTRRPPRAPAARPSRRRAHWLLLRAKRVAPWSTADRERLAQRHGNPASSWTAALERRAALARRSRRRPGIAGVPGGRPTAARRPYASLGRSACAHGGPGQAGHPEHGAGPARESPRRSRSARTPGRGASAVTPLASLTGVTLGKRIQSAELSIETGACVVLVGKNGAGKSTLLELLA